jgi:hypothetical protein
MRRSPKVSSDILHAQVLEQQCAFRAIRAEDREQLTALHIQVEVVERHRVSKSLRDTR